MKKHTIIWLDITNMLYSIGAEHYYAQLKFNDDPSIDLTRPISAKEALYLNKKDRTGSYARYKAGMEVNRFESPDQIIRYAREVMKEKYPDNFLLKSDKGNASAKPLVYWPAGFQKFALTINRLAAQWEKCGGYGDWRGRGGNDELATKIDREWYSLLTPYFK